MVPSLRSYRPSSWLLLVLGLGMAASPAQAAWLGFRNDAESPVVVQVSCAARDSRPQMLYPGEVAWNCIVRPAPRVIRIYEAKPRRRLLLENTIFCGSEDRFFSVQLKPACLSPLLSARPPYGQPPR